MNFYVKTPTGEVVCLSRDYEVASQVLSFGTFLQLMIRAFEKQNQ